MELAQGQRVLGDSYAFGGQRVPAYPNVSEPWKEFMKLSEQPISRGKIRLPAVQVQGGLEKITETLAMLREYKLSTTKAICEV